MPKLKRKIRMCKELAAAKKKKKDKEDSTVEMQRKMKKVLPFLKSLKMQRKIRMLKRNLQVMKLKKVIFPLKILKMQEINTEKSLQMLKKIFCGLTVKQTKMQTQFMMLYQKTLKI